MGADAAAWRANRGYELLSAERLSVDQRAAMVRSQPLDGVYGYLRPRGGSGLQWRVVDQETALLFFTLQEPGQIPEYVRAQYGASAETLFARLAAERILERLPPSAFVPAAAALSPGWSAPKGSGYAHERLSLEALRYGLALVHLPRRDLALRLYAYGRRPITPTWQRLLEAAGGVDSYLGLSRGPTRSALDSHWVAAAADQRFWRMWRRPHRRPEANAGFKLYVRVAPADLPAAVLAVAETLPAVSGAVAFKVGCDVPGLLRPDKLVVYVTSFDALVASARVLEPRLFGLAVHGVPFTASAAADGLLSWGVDPVDPSQQSVSPRWGSWRTWVAERIADHLCAAQEPNIGMDERAGVVLGRLRADGIDTDRWAPFGARFPPVAVVA